MPELITDPPPAAPLIVYEPNEAAIARVRDEFADLLRDPDICKTPEGYDRVKAALRVIVPMRTAIEKARKEQKEDSLTWGKKVDAEAKRLTARVLEIEEPLKARKDAVDAAAELAARKIVEEQMAKEKAEADRVIAERAAAERAQREAEAAERRAAMEQIERERAAWQAEQAKMREANRIEEETRQEAARVEWARLAEERRLQKAEDDRIAAERATLRQEQEKADRIKFEEATKARLERESEERVRADLEAKAERERREKVDEERRQKEQAERDAADRRAEEEAQPDVERLRMFSYKLEALADELPVCKSAKATTFRNSINVTLTDLITKCRGYKAR